MPVASTWGSYSAALWHTLLFTPPWSKLRGSVDMPLIVFIYLISFYGLFLQAMSSSYTPLLQDTLRGAK